MKRALKVSLPSDREIVMTRVFDAPRRSVWAAMTQPDMIRRWIYFPQGWEMVQCDEDVRVSGRYEWTWNGADGQFAMRISGEYREVVHPERLTRTEVMEVAPMGVLGEMLATMTLAEKDGQTLMTLRMIFDSKEARDGALASGMEVGMNAGYDKMDEILATESAALAS